MVSQLLISRLTCWYTSSCALLLACLGWGALWLVLDLLFEHRQLVLPDAEVALTLEAIVFPLNKEQLGTVAADRAFLDDRILVCKA